ncbi:hypothetical protein KSP39_PZI000278 [Platanthera zijinensis]|uniref:Uncharacterized protein n=1 Tax=Platanthera zijinensis TaxID=2320716 RepID=A0AAP0C1N9_9ASPA
MNTTAPAVALLLAALVAASTAARNPDPSSGGFFGPGGQFNIPGLGGGNGWPENPVGGYGGGYGNPSGGHSHNGVNPPSVVCADRGPCHKKRLTCPAKCFTSYSGSGKGYGGGGGGGGCTIDCKHKCVAYC